mmetsp:Transcript_31294/g.99841  ORF Transcript_31294/g.99841 Transcript_31294/m.99841 type:complete len:411 (+) Transcript_31294:766-1998(+)
MPLLLAHIAREAAHGHAAGLELGLGVFQAARPVVEHKHLLRIEGVDGAAERVDLVARVHHDVRVLEVRRQGAVLGLVLVMLVDVREARGFADGGLVHAPLGGGLGEGPVVEGRRDEDRLAAALHLLAGVGDDAYHLLLVLLGKEVVGLVEDEDLAVVRPQHPKLGELKDAARGAHHQHGLLLADVLHLPVDVGASDGLLDHPPPRLPQDFLSLADDLHGQLAGRRHHQCVDALARSLVLKVEEALSENREQEREGLARSRVGLDGSVSACQHLGDGRHLDFCGQGVVEALQPLCQGGVHANALESLRGGRGVGLHNASQLLEGERGGFLGSFLRLGRGGGECLSRLGAGPPREGAGARAAAGEAHAAHEGLREGAPSQPPREHGQGSGRGGHGSPAGTVAGASWPCPRAC